MANHSDARGLLRQAMEAVDTVVFGHGALKESAIICLIAGGHLIIESAPGEGKTLFIKAFSKSLGLEEDRIPFGPELRPSGITGFMDRDPTSDEPFLNKGPIFANVVLADEINAAPDNVQNTLLEPMQEGQVTIPGYGTAPLPKPQFILATLNPVEREKARHPLPKAQLDRFLLKEKLSYPARETLMRIMVHDAEGALESVRPVLDRETILSVMAEVRTRWSRSDSRHPLIDYITRLAYVLREELSEEEYGASPRACNKLWAAVSAYAWWKGRDEPGLADLIHPTEASSTPLIYRVWRHRMVVEDERRADELIRGAIAKTPPVAR